MNKDTEKIAAEAIDLHLEVFMIAKIAHAGWEPIGEYWCKDGVKRDTAPQEVAERDYPEGSNIWDFTLYDAYLMYKHLQQEEDIPDD